MKEEIVSIFIPLWSGKTKEIKTGIKDLKDKLKRFQKMNIIMKETFIKIRSMEKENFIMENYIMTENGKTENFQKGNIIPIYWKL